MSGEELEAFNRAVDKAYIRCVGLMRRYGDYWIFRVGELGLTSDVENTMRSRYGLWAPVDTEKHIGSIYAYMHKVQGM